MPRNNARNVFTYKQRHFRLGLCIDCPRPAEPGKLKCRMCNENHRKRNTINNSKYVKQRKEQKLCIRCNTPLIEGELTKCVNCKDSLQGADQYATHRQRFAVQL